MSNSKGGIFEDLDISMEMFDDLPLSLRQAINNSALKYSIREIYKMLEEAIYRNPHFNDREIIDVIIEKIEHSDEIEKKKTEILHGKKIDLRQN